MFGQELVEGGKQPNEALIEELIENKQESKGHYNWPYAAYLQRFGGKGIISRLKISNYLGLLGQSLDE